MAQAALQKALAILTHLGRDVADGGSADFLQEADAYLTSAIGLLPDAGALRQRIAELDQRLAESFGIPVADLKPWHYHDPFFQETPMVYALDLDSYYEQRDVAELSQAYFAGIGLPDDVPGNALAEPRGRLLHRPVQFGHDEQRGPGCLRRPPRCA